MYVCVVCGVRGGLVGRKAQGERSRSAFVARTREDEDIKEAQMRARKSR